MKNYFILFSLLYFTYGYAQKTTKMEAIKTNEFEITGEGKSAEWNAASWEIIPQRAHLDLPMETKVKVLYSDKGIYFLFYNEDPKLDASLTQDGLHLWEEDVVEVFIWPNQKKEAYLEYELSPLNYELPLMVMNFDGKPHRWQLWNYEDDRVIQHKTAIQGGEKTAGAAIKSWTGEFFIPYTVLAPMTTDKPKSGTEWRINFNRMDYFKKEGIHWSWADLPGSFHEINKYGTILFK